MTENGSGKPDCDCKVGRVIRDRDPQVTDAELARRWVEEGESLRDLAERFNVAVVRAAAADAGATPLDGEAQNLYRLLREDDVTRGMRMAARNRLEDEGVDVDSLEGDFVSHQTIHSHLTDCLGASKESSGPDRPVETERDRIRSLQNRLAVVTDDSIDRLRRNDHLDVESVDVYVDVSVVCESCGRRHQLDELLTAGGCSCQS